MYAIQGLVLSFVSDLSVVPVPNSIKLFSREFCLASSFARQENSAVPVTAMVNVQYFVCSRYN